MNKAFAYNEEFQWIEAEVKGEKKFFVEGYISTIDKDDHNEVVTSSCQEKVLSQVKGKTITMDVEHEEWYDENGQLLPRPKNEKIPVAKIVESELRPRGVWVKAEINKHSGRFNEIWNSIKGGFLHSFSIGFYPIKAIVKNVNGTYIKFLEDLNLINVTLTGSPVNSSATFRPVMKAVLSQVEVINMTEGEPKPVEPVQPTEPVEPKPVEPVEAKPAEPAEPVEPVETVEPVEPAEPVKPVEPVEPTEQVEPAEPAEQEGPLAQIKAFQKVIEKQQETISELKAELKSFMEKPMFKGSFESQVKPSVKGNNVKVGNPLDSI